MSPSKPESEDERRGRVLRELEGKNVAHYAAMVAAWVETRMERDRLLATLSTAAIGLLVTILTTVGVQSGEILGLNVLAISCFVGTIILTIRIYQQNSKLIEQEMKGPEAGELKTIDLTAYDNWSFGLFILGILSSAMIGLTSAYQQFEWKEQVIMARDDIETTQGSGSGLVKKSLQGIGQLRPSEPPQMAESTTTADQAPAADSSGTPTGGQESAQEK